MCDVRNSKLDAQYRMQRSAAALPRVGTGQACQRMALRSRGASCCRARAMTLLELLLALAGTAVIGTAVVTMLVGVSYGTRADKDLRSLITKQMALRSRIEAEVRESRLVLDQGTGYLVLWAEDLDDSGTPDKTEIQVIELDAGTGVVTRYAPADGIADVAYALSNDFRTLTDAYKGDATFPGETWASGVTLLTFSLDDADPQLSRLVAFRVGMTGGEVPDTAIGAAAIRNEARE